MLLGPQYETCIDGCPSPVPHVSRLTFTLPGLIRVTVKMFILLPGDNQCWNVPHGIDVTRPRRYRRGVSERQNMMAYNGYIHFAPQQR